MFKVVKLRYEKHGIVALTFLDRLLDFILYLTDLFFLPFSYRQWLPKSKMVPLGIDETIDKLKMMEGRNSSIRKAVRIAFDRAMNHLSRVHGEPVSDFSDID